MEYYLDTSLMFQKPTGKCKKLTAYPDHVFEIFGRYTNETAHEVCANLLDYVKSYWDQFAKCFIVVLTMENMSMLEWLSNIEHPYMSADEAALYSLCHMYSRHSLVYTVGSVWMTLKLKCQTSVKLIQLKCDLHFAFLDGGVIRILLHKLCIP